MKQPSLKLASKIVVMISLLPLQVKGLPPTGATTGGSKGYRRFHANDSYIGMPIPCSYEEKLCFRYNTLYNPTSGRCLPQSYDNCKYVGDREEFRNGSGRLYATCPGYEDPCPGYRMAFDGRCYTKEIVRDVICGCDAEPTKHFLGGVECRCSPSAPVHVEQPKERRRCRVSDLRFPNLDQSHFFKSLFRAPVRLNVPFQCPEEQQRCFAAMKFWVSGAAGCFELHTREPCGKGHVVALNMERLTDPAMCVTVGNGCPVGKIRMAYDGKCHLETKMKILSPTPLVRSVFGVYGTYATTIIPENRFGSCVLSVLRGHQSPEPFHNYPKPVCGGDDTGLCSLYKVLPCHSRRILPLHYFTFSTII